MELYLKQKRGLSPGYEILDGHGALLFTAEGFRNERKLVHIRNTENLYLASVRVEAGSAHAILYGITGEDPHFVSVYEKDRRVGEVLRTDMGYAYEQRGLYAEVRGRGRTIRIRDREGFLIASVSRLRFRRPDFYVMSIARRRSAFDVVIMTLAVDMDCTL